MKIIFVCTGNTCRSPLAESSAQHYMPDVDSESRGIFAMDGAPVSAHSIEILKSKGYPEPRSAQSLGDGVKEADLILTMTREHQQIIQSMNPDARHVFTLNEYVGLDGDVADPIGGSKATYAETFEQIDHAVRLLSKKLSNEQ